MEVEIVWNFLIHMWNSIVKVRKQNTEKHRLMHSAQCAFFFVSPFSSTSSMLRIDVSIVFHLLFKGFDLFSSVVATRRVAHLKQLECLIWKKNMSSSILERFSFFQIWFWLTFQFLFVDFCLIMLVFSLSDST